jgi:hypothetical protein
MRRLRAAQPGISLALKARHSRQSLGQHPRVMEIRKISAESAIHFSTYLDGDLNSWAMPQAGLI